MNVGLRPQRTSNDCLQKSLHLTMTMTPAKPERIRLLPDCQVARAADQAILSSRIRMVDSSSRYDCLSSAINGEADDNHLID